MKFELLSEDKGAKTWKISAIHVTRSGNGRLYTKQELVQAAETLSFRPVNINHDPAKRLPYPDNCTLHPMAFDTQTNAVVGSMRIADMQVNKKIESGEIDHLSVEQMSNEACSDALCSSKLQYGIAFTGLALLEKGVQPGDAKTSIKAESAADLLISDMVKPCSNCQEQVSSFVNKKGCFRQMSTQPELAKINQEANIRIPGVLDDRIVGFTAEQFETIKNYEQRQLDTLTSLLTKVESVIPRPDGAPSSPVSDGADRFDGNDYNKVVKQIGRVVSKTTNYAAVDDDFVILCDATSAGITITLPTAAGRKGKAFCIKKTDSSANTVTIDGNASETIDGATTKVLSTQYSAKWIISDGANWVIIASV